MTFQIRRSPSASPDRSISISAGSSRELLALRQQYERNHCVRIPGLLGPELLGRIRRELAEAEFAPREVELKRELLMKPGRALALLMFLANDPKLFELVRAITGCPQIGYFEGRVYRMLPGAGHESGWHDDLTGDRLLAMSVNLSESPYSGGVLEIRDSRSRETLQRVANTGPGETILIRLTPGLQHRVTRLDGTVVKTAFVGFFVSTPDSSSERRAIHLAVQAGLTMDPRHRVLATPAGSRATADS